jgi:dienelactone hydrolase
LLVLITDIFGETNWCQSLIQTWRAKGHNVICISPYIAPYDSLTDVTLFANEEQAYQQFQLSGGIDSYAEKVEQALQQATPETNEPIICVGFSVGASALWQVAAMSFVKDKVKHCIGFYPGQIRHSLELTPQIPFSLVFPESEDHFDVETVIQHLVTKQNVDVIQVGLKHGYANPQSDNFNDLASRELTQLLAQVLTQTLDEPKSFMQQLSLQTHEYKGINNGTDHNIH